MWLSTILAVGLVIDAVARAGWVDTVLYLPWVLLGLWVIYVITFSSHVAVDASSVTVVNMLRRTHAPWTNVTDVFMRWQLVFSFADASSVSAYGGPARQRPRRARQNGAPAPAAKLDDVDTIIGLWQDAKQSRSVTDAAPTRRSWNVLALGALAIIIVWLLVAVISTQAGK